MRHVKEAVSARHFRHPETCRTCATKNFFGIAKISATACEVPLWCLNSNKEALYRLTKALQQLCKEWLMAMLGTNIFKSGATSGLKDR